MRKVLHCNHRDYTQIDVEGEAKPIMAYRSHRGHPTRWQPCSGIAPCPGIQSGTAPDTKEFWEGQIPGYKNGRIQGAMAKLDAENLPKGVASNPLEINETFGAAELNESLVRADNFLRATDQRGFLGEHQETEGKPGNWFCAEMLRINQMRRTKHRGALVGAALATAACILMACPAQGSPKPDICPEWTQAHQTLQSLSGTEIKALLKAIPEKERRELVALLPRHVMPALIPRDLAAKNIDLAPAREIKKGFDRMSTQEFAQTAAQVAKPVANNLLALLRNTLAGRDQQVAAIQ
jgi:hypothetical protein